MKGWRKTVNIKDLLTDDGSPEECVRVATAIANRLCQAFPDPHDDLLCIIEDFEDINVNDKRPVALVNDMLNDLYDWADANRIWLGLRTYT